MRLKRRGVTKEDAPQRAVAAAASLHARRRTQSACHWPGQHMCTALLVVVLVLSPPRCQLTPGSTVAHTLAADVRSNFHIVLITFRTLWAGHPEGHMHILPTCCTHS